MGAISNTIVLGIIDKVTAVINSQAAAYTATTDLYDIVAREDNPDDIPLLTRAITTDAAFENSTRLYTQVSDTLAGLAARAMEAGSTNVADLLGDRYLRVPESYGTLIGTPNGNAVPVANLFPDTEVSLGTFAHGGAFVAGDDVTTGMYFWGVIEVGTGAIGISNWNLTITVTYADDTSGNETVQVTSGAAEGTQFNIGAQALDALAAAGQTVVPLAATTGMVAGQFVLLVDTAWPCLLIANAAGAQAVIQVDPTQVGALNTLGRKAVTIRKDSANETAEIDSINYETGEITLSSVLANSYAVANNAFVYLTTPDGDGWQECHEIDSVAAGVSITVTGNLQHSYYTNGDAVRLIKDVTNIVTASLGTAGDDVIAKTLSERTISQ